MADLLSGGVIYSTTTIRIPAELKARARDAGINLSRSLREALEEKLAEGAPTATNERAPFTPTPGKGGARHD